MSDRYLLDTHALVFWNLKQGVSDEFVTFFDEQAENGSVFISSVSFWEIALIVKKGRIEIDDVNAWKTELIENTGIVLIDPVASEMIDSVSLPDIHKDPFDRLLIVQANQHHLYLVTKDETIKNYDVNVFWM